jgi:hypothetical protein
LLCYQALLLLPNISQMEAKERTMTELLRHRSQLEKSPFPACQLSIFKSLSAA